MFPRAGIRCWRHVLRASTSNLLLIGLLASIMVGGPASAATTSPDGTPLATHGPILPTSGAWVGSYVAQGDHHGASHDQAMDDFESDAGRRMAIDHDYFAWDVEFPDGVDDESRDQGRILFISWNAMTSGGTCTKWSSIASGSKDATIDARAADLKDFGAPLFFAFHHEPEDQVGDCGSENDFVNAWRHIHDRFAQDGVTNISWVWVLMAYTFRIDEADQYYPGNSYVDLIGADGYNWYSCPGRDDGWSDFSQVFGKFHDFGVAKGKPELIAEFSSMEDPDDPGHKGEWISDAAATIKSWPEIKGALWYDNGPPMADCTWWVDTSASSQSAFNAMGADPYFNPAPPLVTINSGPPDLSNSTSATFTFESNMPGSTFTCRVDAGTANNCSSPYTFTGLSQGDHVATISATDPPSGQSNYTTYAWTVDSIAPIPSIDSSPDDPTDDPSADFKFSSNEWGSTFSCKLDAGSYADCDSPLTYDDLADGAHTFNVKATDLAGNTSAPAVWSWDVDTAPPTATITGNPLQFTKDHSSTFTFTSSEAGSTFKCWKDDGSPSACTSPKVYSWLGDGPHDFSVTATDPAGNTSASADYAWTIDSTKPAVTITSGPDDPTRSTSAAFTFKVDDATDTTATCQLDGGPTVTCSGGVAGSAGDAFGRTISDGWGTADQGGSWTTTGGAASEFAVNGSAATMSLTTANVARLAYLPNSWGDTDFLFRVSFDRKPVGSMRVIGYGLARYDPASGAFYAVRASLVWDGSVRLDATKKPSVGVEASVGTESNLGTIGSANTWYWVRGHVGDEAGGVRIQGRLWKDGSPEPNTWQYSYLDTTSPIAATGKVGVRSASWATDTPYTVSFDDFSGSTGLSYSGLAPGAHLETVTATDQAGNVGTASWAWSIDLTPPIASITSGPSSPTNATSATFKFSSNESGGTFTCQLDSGSATTCTSPKTYSGLGSGSHTFILTATDKAGNVSLPVTWIWTIDTVPPVATITGSPPLITKLHTATFTFTSNESGSTFKCSRDGASYSPCTSPKVYSWFSDGVHTFAVQATDPAGNISAPATYTWTVDSTKPTVTITSGPSNPDSHGTVTFTFTSNESNVTFTCQLDSGSSTTCTSPKTYTGITSGSHTFKLYGVDQAGNQSSTKTWTWVKS
jgi:hypothetical protein